MKEIVVFKFKFFDESIKQKAMEVAREFPGVNSVMDVEGEGQLEVRGEFDKFKMTKELKKIDESVDIFKIERDGETEPKVNTSPIAETFPAFIEKEEVTKPTDDAGSSYWPTLNPYGWWEQAKVYGGGAAGQAKVIGWGAAKHAKVIGGVAAGQAKVLGVNAVEKAKAVYADAEKYKKQREEDEKRRRYKEWEKEDARKRRKEWLEKMNKEPTQTKYSTHNSDGQKTQCCTGNKTGFTDKVKTTFSTLTTGQTNQCCCKGCKPSTS